MVTFDNSRVMYGFCSMKEPTASLPRYILINWVSRRGFGGRAAVHTPAGTCAHTHKLKYEVLEGATIIRGQRTFQFAVCLMRFRPRHSVTELQPRLIDAVAALYRLKKYLPRVNTVLCFLTSWGQQHWLHTAVFSDNTRHIGITCLFKPIICFLL